MRTNLLPTESAPALAELEILAAHLESEIAARREQPELMFSSALRLQAEVEIFELREELRLVRGLLEARETSHASAQTLIGLPSPSSFAA